MSYHKDKKIDEIIPFPSAIGGGILFSGDCEEYEMDIRFGQDIESPMIHFNLGVHDLNLETIDDVQYFTIISNDGLPEDNDSYNAQYLVFKVTYDQQEASE